MQINIDKKTGTFLGIIATLILAVVFLLAGKSSMPMDHSGHSTAMSSDEIMFAQMMIPHHSQAVTISESALKNSTTPAILELAQAIRDAQAPEIELMQGWLEASGASESHMHDMNMGGMLSDEKLAELSSLRGTDFDTLFLTSMIAHHEGALQMLSMIKDSDKSEVKKLYTNILTSQSDEIETMKALLK